MRTLVQRAVVAAAGLSILATTAASPADRTGPAPWPGSRDEPARYAGKAPGAASPGPQLPAAPPAGTEVTVRMLEPVDSSSGSADRTYLASVTQPVDLGNGGVIATSAPATVRLVQTADGWIAQLTSVMIVGQKVPVTSVSASLDTGGTAGSTSSALAKLAGRTASGQRVLLPAGTEVRFVLGDRVPEQTTASAAPRAAMSTGQAAQSLPTPPSYIEHGAANSSAASVAPEHAPAAGSAPARGVGQNVAPNRPAAPRRTATPVPAAPPAAGGADRPASRSSGREPSKSEPNTQPATHRSHAKQQKTNVAKTKSTASSAEKAPVLPPPAPTSVTPGVARRANPAKPPASSVPAASPAPPPPTTSAGVFCVASDPPAAYFSAAFESARAAAQEGSSFAAFLRRKYRYQGSATCASSDGLAGARRSLAARINAARSAGKKVVETGWTASGNASRAPAK